MWVRRMGKTGVGHSYRNKAEGLISGSDGCLLGKSKRRSLDNSFACQVQVHKGWRLAWERRWVSLARFTESLSCEHVGTSQTHLPGKFSTSAESSTYPVFWTCLSTLVQYFCFTIRRKQSTHANHQRENKQVYLKNCLDIWGLLLSPIFKQPFLTYNFYYIPSFLSQYFFLKILAN